MHELELPDASPQKALSCVLLSVIEAGEAGVTPAVETQLQSALFWARLAGSEATYLREIEEAATLLAIISNSRRSGRPNLAASTMLRLKRLVQRGGLDARLH